MAKETQTLYLEGMFNYAKVYRPDQKYNNYTVDFYPTPEAEKQMKAAGLKLEAKESDDGTFYRLRRPVEKLIRGEPVQFGAPKVVKNTGEVNSDGVPVTEPFKELIGNGSTGVARVTVYPAGAYVGHRLEALRIDKHVPYTPKEKPATPEYPF